MNLRLNPYSAFHLYFIGAAALMAMAAACILAQHNADAVFSNHMMGMIVLGLNLFCLLALQYQQFELRNLKRFFVSAQHVNVDHAMLNELRVLTPAEFKNIITQYCINMPHLLRELHDAVTARHGSEIVRLVRRIRSSSVQLGGIRFAALAYEIEYHASARKFHAMKKLLAAAITAYGEMQAELQNSQ